MRNYIILLAFVLCGACQAEKTFILLQTPVSYPDAVEACQIEGGELAELEGSAEIQEAYDLWATADVPAEGLYVGNFITNVAGTEYGYVMLRGGVLAPVELTEQRLGLVLCEVRK